MASILAELSKILHEHREIVGDEVSRRDSARHMQRLQGVSERLEEMERRLSKAIDPQLRHFLQRRSYSKALEYLDASGLSSEGKRGSNPANQGR
ncbi:MAG: hypothetical protein ACR2ID_04695 [Chthoniobacterales bacterium]